MVLRVDVRLFTHSEAETRLRHNSERDPRKYVLLPTEVHIIKLLHRRRLHNVLLVVKGSQYEFYINKFYKND